MSLIVIEIQDHLSLCSSGSTLCEARMDIEEGSTQAGNAFIRVDIPQLSSICMSNDEGWQIKINDTFLDTHTLLYFQDFDTFKSTFGSVGKSETEFDNKLHTRITNP